MTNTYKNLFLGTAAILTMSAGAVMAQDSIQVNSKVSADVESQANSDYPVPSSPVVGDTINDTGVGIDVKANTDLDTSESRIGGQEDEYVPERRNQLTDALGTNEDAAQVDLSSNADTSVKASPDAVANVQEKLNREGFKVSVDGVVGQETRRALKSFQASNDLSATGEIDTQTMAALSLSNN